MTAEAESTNAVVPRSPKQDPAQDEPSKPEGQRDASASGPAADDDGPDEAVRAAA